MCYMFCLLAFYGDSGLVSTLKYFGKQKSYIITTPYNMFVTGIIIILVIYERNQEEEIGQEMSSETD